MTLPIFLENGAQLPTRGTPDSAGLDLHAFLERDKVGINPHETKLLRTGVRVVIPRDFVGLVFARSGISSKRGLAPINAVGVIDSDYAGEIFVPLHNHRESMQTVEDGERIAQLVLVPVVMLETMKIDNDAFNAAHATKNSTRGEGGLGSTGMK